MSLLGQLRTWWSTSQQNRASTHFEVRCDEFGVTQISKTGAMEHRVHLSWDQVTAVYAFKRDCFSVDQIRLIVSNESLRVWIEMTEDEIGYEEMISQLPRHLMGFPSADDWWRPVALPPFKTNWTPLYRRDPPADP